jgi:hypothetical protein
MAEHHWLEYAHWGSQVWLSAVLFVTAIGATLGAFLQLREFKRFELLKFLEAPQVRTARRLVYQQFYATEEPPPGWWNTDDDLENAAATVCASFDIVGLMAKGYNRTFFVHEWARPICWTYIHLESYMKARNPGGYRGYRELYQ